MTNSFQHKVVSLERLTSLAADARQEGKTVVQCHGCFDIVHPGHVRYLEFARRQGDLLIVSLTGDSEVNKGTGRPYIPQELRAENLAALMFVDYVYINPEPTAEAVLHCVQPDLYVKGREYERCTEPGFLAEKAVVEGCGGRILFSSGEVVFSSSELIESIPRGPHESTQRLQLICRRHDVSLRSLEHTLDRFRGLHVLIVGDIVLDRYVLCDAIGVASESPMMSLAQRDECQYLGGAAIVARHVAALGGRPFLLSAGAEDETTQHVAALLTREGVEAHLIPCRPSLVEKTRFLVEDTKVFKLERAERLPLDSAAEREASALLEQQSRVADAAIFCDFGFGMLTGSLLERVLPVLRQNVGTMAADISGGRADLLAFKNVDLLCPTEREARRSLNDHDGGLSTIAGNVLHKTQAKHLFVTLEKHGMVVFERRSGDRTSPDWSARLKSESLPSFVDHPVDLLGCGDALLASATMALAAGAELMQAAWLGNAAAAIEAGLRGNQPVHADPLRAWLRRRPELLEGPIDDASVPVNQQRGAAPAGLTA